jgi:hypothetical protein
VGEMTRNPLGSGGAQQLTRQDPPSLPSRRPTSHLFNTRENHALYYCEQMYLVHVSSAHSSTYHFCCAPFRMFATRVGKSLPSGIW